MLIDIRVHRAENVRCSFEVVTQMTERGRDRLLPGAEILPPPRSSFAVSFGGSTQCFNHHANSSIARIPNIKGIEGL